MSYFDNYEGCWKLIHAMAEHFPLIGLYGKFGIPEPAQTISSGRFKSNTSITTSYIVMLTKEHNTVRGARAAVGE